MLTKLFSSGYIISMSSAFDLISGRPGGHLLRPFTDPNKFNPRGQVGCCVFLILLISTPHDVCLLKETSLQWERD